MNFLSTGVKELTRRLRRSKNRLALTNARKALDRADTTLGRHAWRELVGDETEEVRTAFTDLHRLDDGVEAARLRVAELEGDVRTRESAREAARREHAQDLAAIDEEREPIQERLVALRESLAGHSRVLHEQNNRKKELNAAQTALLKREKRTRRQTVLQTDWERVENQRELEAERTRLTEEAAHLAASRSEAVEPMVGDETTIKEVKAALAELDARAARARAALAARDREAVLAIAGLHKEIAAIRRQAADTEADKGDAYLAIGRRLAGREDAPRGADEPFGASRRQRGTVERLTGLETTWGEESRNADRQDLRVFYFVASTVAVLAVLVSLLIVKGPVKRDWLPANTVAVVAVDVRGFTDADFARFLEAKEPETWRTVWTGLVQAVTDVPQIDVRRQVARITRALAPADARGPAVDCLLVELRASVDVDSLLRTKVAEGSGGGTFRRRSFEGVGIYEKPDGAAALAQIGPGTLALGPRASVEALIRVRLGLREDLKSDAQFLSEFQRLGEGSAFRLVTYRPQELTALADTVLSPELLAHCTALGLTLDMREPMSAVFLLNTSSAQETGQMTRQLMASPDAALQLRSAGPNLFIEPPSVAKVHDTQVEWRFRMTEPAAKEFLERVSRLEMSTPGAGGKVARRGGGEP